MARTVTDAALLQVLAGHDPGELGTADVPVPSYADWFGGDLAGLPTNCCTSAPGNLTGLPALSLPCGYDGQGLPIGMQIIGRPFDEPGVLRIGSVFETATDFANSTPTGLG